jgi:hypothetical protein
VPRLSRKLQYQGYHGNYSPKAITETTVPRLSRKLQCQGYHVNYSAKAIKNITVGPGFTSLDLLGAAKKSTVRTNEN